MGQFFHTYVHSVGSVGKNESVKHYHPPLRYIQSIAVWVNKEQGHPRSLNSTDWNVRCAGFASLTSVSMSASKHNTRDAALDYHSTHYSYFLTVPTFITQLSADVSVVVSYSHSSEVNTACVISRLSSRLVLLCHKLMPVMMTVPF